MKVQRYNPKTKEIDIIEVSKNTMADNHELNLRADSKDNPINTTIKILLDLADIADNTHESPLGKRSDSRAFALNVREGAKAIIELQNDYFHYKEKAERYEKSTKCWEAFSKAKFGVPDFAELIVDPDRLGRMLNQVLGEDDKDVNS